MICGVVAPSAGPAGEPVACAYRPKHKGDHSWVFLPTWAAVVEAWRDFDQKRLDELLLAPEGEPRG